MKPTRQFSTRDPPSTRCLRARAAPIPTHRMEAHPGDGFSSLLVRRLDADALIGHDSRLSDLFLKLMVCLIRVRGRSPRREGSLWSTAKPPGPLLHPERSQGKAGARSEGQRAPGALTPPRCPRGHPAQSSVPPCGQGHAIYLFIYYF